MKLQIQYLPAATKVVDRIETGKAAKLYRESKGVTQDELAAAFNFTRNNISNRERGRFAWDVENFKEYTDKVDSIKK